MLQRLAADAALEGLNHLLRHEQHARDLLRPLAGRAARIAAGPLAVQFVVGADGLVQPGEGEPQVTVRIELAALLRDPPPAGPGGLPDPDRILRHAHIQGDAGFARVLAQVAAELRPDLEEDLSRIVGDAAAVRIMSAVHAARRGLQDSGARAARQAADYLAGERPWLVSKAPFDRFAAEVTELARAAERLAERTGRLS